MKVGVVGCGALGSYYGAKLSRAGQTVHFLMRSDFEVVRRQGLSIRSPQGSFLLHPPCAQDPQEIGFCDLVLIGLKTTANHQFPKLLPPLVKPSTIFLTLQNGLGNEEQLARLFPPSQIMGGLAFVCLNRVAPGVIHHLDHGAIVIGEYQGGPTPRTEALAEMFRNAGVDCSVTPNLAQAHWEKLIWNIPFNGLGVASSAGYEAVHSGDPRHVPVVPGPCLTTDLLLADTGWAQLVRELMGEVVSSGRALGFKISESLSDELLKKTYSMGAYKPSTVLDFERGQAIELEGLFLEPLRQAQAAGVATPRLAALCEILTTIAPRSA